MPLWFQISRERELQRMKKRKSREIYRKGQNKIRAYYKSSRYSCKEKSVEKKRGREIKELNDCIYNSSLSTDLLSSFSIDKRK